MIISEGKYYLYRHIRNDKNEVFYIGIGSKYKRSFDTYKSIYTRAYETKSRNLIWKRITEKCEYNIEIILESDNISFIKEKEIEFIKLYGRRDLGLGTLCNLTDGGDGINNYVMTKEVKIKIGNSNRGNNAGLGKPKSESHIMNMCKAAKLRGVSDKCRKAGRIQLLSRSKEFYKMIRDKSIIVNSKPVEKLSKNRELIEIYNSMAEAGKFNNTTNSKISECCSGKRKTAGGFIWKYKN